MRAHGSPRRRRLILIITLVLAGLITHGTYAGSGDEPHYLAIAHSLAFDRDLDLSNNYGAAEPLIAGGALEPGQHIQPGAGGTMRPVHDIGLPALLAPVSAVAAPAVAWAAPQVPQRIMRRLRLTPSTAYRNLLSVVMIGLAVMLALELFAALVLAGAAEPAAFWTALLVALSPPLLIHSILLFTEVLSALLVLLVFRRVTLERDGSIWRWGVLGVVVGLLVLVHVRNIGLAAALFALGGWTLLRARDRARLAAFAAGTTIVVLLRTAITFAMWGTWVTTPHAREGHWTGLASTVMESGRRLAGLLLDQEFGLLPYAPVFVALVPGLVALARRRPTLAGHIALVAGAYAITVLLPFVNVHGWTGGWSPAARFLVPILPLMALALPAGLAALGRPIAIVLVAVQVALNAYFWQHPKNLWNDGDGVAAACARGTLPVCRYLPSFVDVRRVERP